MGDARRDAGNVALFGDLPFMVSGDSADVWARQDEFRLDASIGVPPDAFSETGQNWEMPVYRWDVLAERGFDWLRDRARRNAALFDGYRVDHLVGFYRTYFRPHDGSAAQFSPPDEPSQSSSASACWRYSGARAHTLPRKISGSSRNSSAIRSPERALPATRCCGGNGIGTRMDNRSKIRAITRRSVWQRQERTIPSRWLRGGRTRHGRKDRRCLRSRRCAHD